MKRISMFIMGLFIMMFATLSIPNIAHGNEVTVDNAQATIKLTKEQQKELADLHKEVLEKRKQIVSKYVEYGVMTKERSEALISQFEEHYKALEKNQFYPRNCDGKPKWNKRR